MKRAAWWLARLSVAGGRWHALSLRRAWSRPRSDSPLILGARQATPFRKASRVCHTTVCGTCLVDTGSKMDDAIFQEFKGTGNMEMVLSRDLVDRRIWPAIDITKSGTRREEKLLSPEVFDGVTMLRRSLINMNPVEAMEQLSRTLAKLPSNKELLERLKNIL